jgi:hypothetical protein
MPRSRKRKGAKKHVTRGSKFAFREQFRKGYYDPGKNPMPRKPVNVQHVTRSQSHQRGS